MEESTSLRPGFQPALIRPMETADVDRVVAIADSLPLAPHWPRQAYHDALDLSNGMRRIALVAATAETVLGFVVLGLVLPEAELESIAIASEAQRRGLGRLLLEAGLAAALSRGAGSIFLEIRASNTPAATLYRRAGFLEIGRRPGYYSNPTEDAILMQINLL